MAAGKAAGAAGFDAATRSVSRAIRRFVSITERGKLMAKMRAPKDLDNYISAEDAATSLENLASNIRAHAEDRPMVKWNLKISYWNPHWLEPDNTANPIVRQVSYVSKTDGDPPPDSAEDVAAHPWKK